MDPAAEAIVALNPCNLSLTLRTRTYIRHHQAIELSRCTPVCGSGGRPAAAMAHHTQTTGLLCNNFIRFSVLPSHNAGQGSGLSGALASAGF